MQVSSGSGVILRDLLVLGQVLLQLGILMHTHELQQLLALFALRQCEILLLRVLLSLHVLAAFLLVDLALPTALSFAVVGGGEGLAQGADHVEDFLLVGTVLFVGLLVLVLDDVEAVVGAGGEEVADFEFILTPVDVEDELLAGEGVVGVVGAVGHLFALGLVHWLWFDNQMIKHSDLDLLRCLLCGQKGQGVSSQIQALVLDATAVQLDQHKPTLHPAQTNTPLRISQHKLTLHPGQTKSEGANGARKDYICGKQNRAKHTYYCKQHPTYQHTSYPNTTSQLHSPSLPSQSSISRLLIGQSATPHQLE